MTDKTVILDESSLKLLHQDQDQSRNDVFGEIRKDDIIPINYHYEDPNEEIKRLKNIVSQNEFNHTSKSEPFLENYIQSKVKFEKTIHEFENFKMKTIDVDQIDILKRQLDDIKQVTGLEIEHYVDDQNNMHVKFIFLIGGGVHERSFSCIISDNKVTPVTDNKNISSFITDYSSSLNCKGPDFLYILTKCRLFLSETC